MNGQRNVYLNKNIEDDNLNENKLREIARDNGLDLKSL